MSFGLPSYKVNTATLGLFVEYPFFRTNCVNMMLDIAIRHNSFDSPEGMFGSGWHFSYNSSIRAHLSQRKVLLKRASGQIISFEAMPEADFSNSDYYQLKTAVIGKGRLYEYKDNYIYEDQQQELFYKYIKKADGGICNLSQVIDYCGNVIQINYRADNFIQEIIDPFGRSVRFEYDKLPYCTGILMPDGREASLSYDNKGRIEKIINFADVATTFSYDVKSCLEAIIVGKKLRTTRFTYVKHKDRSLVNTVTDRNGNITKYEMISSSPEIIQVTNPLGTGKKYVSRNGLTERIIDSKGKEIVIEYLNNQPISITDKNGNKKLMAYDVQGNLVRRTDGVGNSESFAYDMNGNLVSYTDALGRVTKNIHDARKNLIRKDMPGGRSNTYHYDERGRLVRMELPNGNATNYQYDAFFNLICMSDNIGHVYQAIYDDMGYQRLECIDANGNRTKTKSDESDRLKEITYADGSVKTFEYDCCAGIITRDQLGSTWFNERDPMSNVIKKVNPTGSLKGYQYNATGRLIKEIDELGNAKTYDYNENGFLSKTTNALGASVFKNIDPNGNIVEVTDENQSRFSFEYNKNNQVRKATDPLGKTTIYGYDAVNNPTFVITPGQHKISYTYDSNNSIVQKLVDDKPLSIFSYNAAGDIVKLTEEAGVVSYEYDIRGRLTSAIYGEKEQVSMEYDLGDNITFIKYPNGISVQYSYDSMGRTQSMVWGGYEIKFTYDAAGRLISEKRSNGTESQFSYDSCHRLREINYSRQGEVFAGMDYSYDVAGNLTEEKRYIPLLDSVPEDISADDIFMTYNSLNQLLQINENMCTFDSDGNMTGMAGNHTAGYRYDAENRLVGKSKALGETVYEYNAFNQLVRINRNGKITMRYYDLMGRNLFETDGQQVYKYFIYNGKELKAMVNSDGSVFFYHYDHRGNTVAITDGCGEPVCAYAYMPYGAVWKKVERIDNCFTFMGAYGVTDEKDGLYMTANRCYDSDTGRFLQQDPLGFVDGQNLYTYAGGNPMTSIDPEGTIIWLIPIAVGLGGYLVYKAVDSAANVGTSVKKYNTKLTKLEEARIYLERAFKGVKNGYLDTSVFWKAKDNYDRALVEAAEQAGETAKTAVYEYALPGGIVGDMVKDITCTPP